MMSGMQVFGIRTRSEGIINYCYLLVDLATREVILIDPSWEYEKIKKAIKNIDGNVSAVLLTHSHTDHTNLVGYFIEDYEADIYMGRQEIKDYGFLCKNLNALDDGDWVNFGKSKIQCIFTPGHTSGSVCYYTDGALFTGDTIFIEGCGICECPGGSSEDMYNSLQKLRMLIHEETKVYPAHCYGKPVGGLFRDVKKNNIYFNIKDEKYFTKFRMRPNQKGLFDFR